MKPEYLFRPMQILHRFRKLQNRVRLPWGHSISIFDDDIGRGIWVLGVYDLAAAETLWRLSEPGETAFDVGANIGVMSSLLSARGCKVLAFEPHPRVFQTLKENAASWPKVECHQVAIGERVGSCKLADHTEENRGTSSVGETGIEVAMQRLTDFPPAAQVMKMDIEGYELHALEGARPMFEARQVRDIVFEQNDEAAVFLRNCGYELFRIERSLFRPLLLPADSKSRTEWLPSNFLATADSARAKSRFQALGWRVLGR